MRSGVVFWGWWDTWERYKHLFPIENYLFLREPNIINDPGETSEFKCDLIFFIDKKIFIKTVEKHRRLFETILDKKIEPRKFLEEVEDGKISFQKSIGNNNMLLGILLGYGKHNSSFSTQKD